MKKTNYDSGTSNMARAAFPAGGRTDLVLRSLEGGKHRLKDGRVSFKASVHNLEIISKNFPSLTVDMPQPLADFDAADKVVTGRRHYQPKTEPFGQYQADALAACVEKSFFALFMDQGTGKTKVAIDKVGHEFARGRVTGVLLVTYKGIHEQWHMSQLPTHLGTVDSQPIKLVSFAWDGKTNPWVDLHQAPDQLEFFCSTFSGIDTTAGVKAVNTFCARHKGTLMIIIDESQGIKSPESSRHISCVNLAPRASVRLILTGTPITKSPLDEWAQARFLSGEIFGHEYKSTFLKEYSKSFRGQFQGWRNLEQFKEKMKPHSYRATKDVLGLPPKVYDTFKFALDTKTRRHYNELKRNFLTQLDNGEIVTVQNAAVALIRLQQMTSGRLVDEDGTVHRFSNDREKAFFSLLPKFEDEESLIIWCRFVQDAEDVFAAIQAKEPGAAILATGALHPNQRQAVVADWMAGRTKYFVSNPAVFGTGWNLQGRCRTAIYYSNSFDALHRWQSEDRIHRIGTTGSVLILDMLATNTVDQKILSNLREKKELSSYLLDDDLSASSAKPLTKSQVQEFRDMLGDDDA